MKTTWMIAEGDLVTWGSGRPRGVVQLLDAELNDVGDVVPFAVVELLDDVVGSCGMRWPKGRTVDVPTRELRALNEA